MAQMPASYRSQWRDFKLVPNLKTVRALGIAIPMGLMRADHHTERFQSKRR
jgi:hypothetical protein